MALKKNTPLGFGMGFLGIMLPSTAFSMFYSYYYVDKLGLALGLYTLARTIYVIWDAFAQPMAGFLSDRTRTRWGRRIPWLVGAIPFYLLFFVLVYSVPGGLEGGVLFAWFLTFHLLFETMMAIIHVNYQGLFPELFTTTEARARTSVIQQGFYIVALLVGTAATPILVGANEDRYTFMALVYAGISAIVLFACLMQLRENPAARAAEPLNLVTAFRTTLSNRSFWLFAVSNMFAAAVVGMVSATMVFYCKYVLGFEGVSVSILMGVTFISVIPMAVVWYFLVKRFGILRSWQASCAVSAITVIPLFFATDLTTGLIAGVILSFGLAGHFVTPNLVQSQLIDVDAARTGRRREGIYTAVGNFVVRASALLTAVSFWVIGLIFGYESGEHPGPQPVLAFRILTAVVPFVLMAISFALALFLKKHHVTVPDQDSDETAPHVPEHDIALGEDPSGR